MLNTHIHLPWHFSGIQKPAVSTKAIGGIALAISIVCGSTYYGFAKELTSALSPLSLMFISELLTGLFVILSFGLVPTVRSLLHITAKQRLALVAIGIFSGVAGPLLLFTALEKTAAVNASFFGNTDTLFMVLLAHFFLKEKFSKGHALASLAIAAGIIMITLQGFTAGLHLRMGDLIILCGTMSFSIGSILFRKYATDMPPHAVLFVRCSFAVGFFFLASPFLPHNFAEEISAFPYALIPVAIGFAFISRFLNSFSFYEALDHMEVSTVSLFGTLTIFGGVLFAYLYVGETVYWYHFVGGAFILAGTVLLELVGPGTKDAALDRTVPQKL